jgi:glycyl-tRNA synthetase
MSLALYPTGQLRFWTEQEISLRDGLIHRLFHVVKAPLQTLNKAWRFERVEGPLLTPADYISPAYTEDDLWVTKGLIAAQGVAMRAETTASSYIYAKHLMSQEGGSNKLPLCVWQSGKSFRKEESDGASASRLRFFEFYQLEFQCIYSKTTGADYVAPVTSRVMKELELITGHKARLVRSDRLPSYSEATFDVEVDFNGHWREMCSISQRTDFEGAKVLEVAIGLDRLVAVIGGGV